MKTVSRESSTSIDLTNTIISDRHDEETRN